MIYPLSETDIDSNVGGSRDVFVRQEGSADSSGLGVLDSGVHCLEFGGNSSAHSCLGCCSTAHSSCCGPHFQQLFIVIN